MKRTTKKLTGIGLELFLRRFYGSYSGIDDTLARRLSQDGAKTFASVRIRRMAWHDRRPNQISDGGAANTVTRPPIEQSTAPPPRAPPSPTAVPTPETPAQPSVTAPQDGSDVPFDPYAIGLVPIYQREGPEGLGAKLADVASLDNLRKMARSQQVALPAELRGDDADIEAVRAAIVKAVGKRIANRRAAAG